MPYQAATAVPSEWPLRRVMDVPCLQARRVVHQRQRPSSSSTVLRCNPRAVLGFLITVTSNRSVMTWAIYLLVAPCFRKGCAASFPMSNTWEMLPWNT